MTKAKKRLLTLLLAMLMAVGMAVPTFADEVQPRSLTIPLINQYVSYGVATANNVEYVMNLPTSAESATEVNLTNMNVNVYNVTGHASQQFMMRSSSGKYYITTKLNPKVALNINNTPKTDTAANGTQFTYYNCNLYPIASNSASDYQLTYERYDYGFYIMLANRTNLKLWTKSLANSANVYWGTTGGVSCGWTNS